MVDPARHTGLPERTLGELSETSLGKKYLIQTRTFVSPSFSTQDAFRGTKLSKCFYITPARGGGGKIAILACPVGLPGGGFRICMVQ